MANDQEISVVAFAGGGTGGHVYPTLAVIESLKKKMADLGAPLRLVRFGPKDGYETLFENQGVHIASIVAGKIRRYASFQNILDLPKFFIGLIEAFIKVFWIMPEVIFSKGGTGALPVIIAGWFYRIPIIIHESDAHPGLTNLVSSRFAKKIYASFEAAANYFPVQKTEVIGTPVRDELQAKQTTKELAKESLGFDPKLPLALILGGSQGSMRINEFILGHAGELLGVTQVLHQTGNANLTDVQRLSHAATIDESYRNRYQAVGYLTNNMNLALTAADLVVMRAGSSSIFEVAAFGVPAILIPLAESANDHQRANAYDFAKSGGGVVIEESNLLPGIFMSQLKNILMNDAVWQKMAHASARFFIPGAADKIALEIIENLK